MLAHKLIAKTAVEMAEAMFEEVMRDNTIYAAHKRLCPELTPKMQRKLFVQLLAPHYIEPARATLAGMLDGNYPQSLKDQIFDALSKDQTLRTMPHANRARRRRAGH